VIWDVHDAAKVVVIRLTDDRYTRLVVGVDDPAQTVATIRQALGTAGEGSEPVASHRGVVEAYVEGFRRSDHEAILACLTDDVEWVHGYRTLQGKAAFEGEIESDVAVGSPTLHLDRLIEEGDTVVAIGQRRDDPRGGRPRRLRLRRGLHLHRQQDQPAGDLPHQPRYAIHWPGRLTRLLTASGIGWSRSLTRTSWRTSSPPVCS
jgi:uncharacterized protein